MNARPHLLLLMAASIGLLTALSTGCSPTEVDSVDERLAKLDALVPASGVVTISGKPVAGVVVTFISTDWAPAHAETDEEGKFSLSTAARPGAIPGEYSVILSLLVAKNGKPLGLRPRNSLTPHPDLVDADELLPPSVSSMEQSTLTATVTPEGGTYTFEVDAELPELPPQTDDLPDEAELESE